MNYFDVIADVVIFVISNDHLHLIFLRNIVVVFFDNEHVVILILFETSLAHVQKFKFTNVLILHLLHQCNQ